MKYVDEFRKKDVVLKLSEEIKKIDAPARIMEVCGTHTMSIFKYGLKDLLPSNISLLSGPGCPVCVTSQEDIDKMTACADIKDAIVATFGDMIKVPGSSSSLKAKREEGRDIRVVYSPLDALLLAKENPKKEVIFIGIGFETTAPLSAGTIIKAKQEGIGNFSVINSHKTMPAALLSLLEAKETRIDGYLCPGHVSVIIGLDPYKEIVKKFRVPCVISGFEPVDIMRSILAIMKMILSGYPEAAVEYGRAVREEGNPKALKVMMEVFEESDAAWRGIGVLPGSGLKIKKEYKAFDAEKKFGIKVGAPQKKTACFCGDILKGNKTPLDCRLFGRRCTPENPLGACMVSSEGTCAAYYKYGKIRGKT